jgi:DNA repair protein RecO (recombination protein O)
MPLVTTPAIVLHAFDYRETSRIVRLITRELGIVSVIARGARRPRNKFGAALDLFAGGEAELVTTLGRDLHALNAFDATRARPALAASLDRFAAAAALAELLLRFAPEQEDPGLLDAVTDALDALESAPPGAAAPVALGGAWSLVAELGFAPSLDSCALCHAPLDPAEAVAFHHRSGGALCAACARRVTGARVLPPEARGAIRAWLGRYASPPLDEPSVRAHQRLLREFLEEHLTDGGRPLRALLAWERHEVDA